MKNVISSSVGIALTLLSLQGTAIADEDSVSSHAKAEPVVRTVKENKRQLVSDIVRSKLRLFLPMDERMGRVLVWFEQSKIEPEEVPPLINRLIPSILNAFKSRGYVVHELETRPSAEHEGKGGITITARFHSSDPTAPIMRFGLIMHSVKNDSMMPNISGGVGPACSFDTRISCQSVADTSELSFNIVGDISKAFGDTFAYITLEELDIPGVSKKTKKEPARPTSIEARSGTLRTPKAFYFYKEAVSPIDLKGSDQ